MGLSWIITVVLGVIIVKLLYWLVKKNENHWEKLGIPHYKSPPLVGIMKDVLLMRKSLTDIMCDIYKEFDGERFCGFFQFTTPMVMIRDPELLNRVLIKDFTHFEDRGLAIENPNDLFSKTITNLTGDEWRDVRYKLTPTFSSGKLKMMFGAMKDSGKDIVEFLESKMDEDIDARDCMLKYIVNVIGNVAFGIRINTLDDNDEQGKTFLKMSSAFLEPSGRNFWRAWVTFLVPKIRVLLNLSFVDKAVDAFFRSLTKDVIEYRETTDTHRNDFLNLMIQLKKREKENSRDGTLKLNTRNMITSPTTEDLELEDKLKIMPDQFQYKPSENYKITKSGEMFTDDFISAQTFLFISAGSETTAGALSFVLYELAANQEIQRRAQEQISEVLSEQDFSFEAVKKMTYLDHCINESLRLHPPAPFLLRICTNNYQIPGTETVIEKGKLLNIPIIAMHTDPQYFPEPEKYNPDRFENTDSTSKSAFMPFGGGPRMCIAMRLAMLEMQVVLATLLKSFTVVLSNKTKLPVTIKKTSLSLHVEGGLWVQFKKRDL